MATYMKLLQGEVETSPGAAGSQDKDVERLLAGFLRAMIDECQGLNESDTQGDLKASQDPPERQPVCLPL